MDTLKDITDNARYVSSLLLPRTMRRAGWTVDELELNAVAQHLRLSSPIVIVPETMRQLSPSWKSRRVLMLAWRKLTHSPNIYARTGLANGDYVYSNREQAHVVRIHDCMPVREVNVTLIHELAHAAQYERGLITWDKHGTIISDHALCEEDAHAKAWELSRRHNVIKRAQGIQRETVGDDARIYHSNGAYA